MGRPARKGTSIAALKEISKDCVVLNVSMVTCAGQIV